MDRFVARIGTPRDPIVALPAPDVIDGCSVLMRGYVADRSELGRLLGAPAGATDAELLVRAYRRWGARAPRHVSGHFAAVVVDPAAGEAALMHDELGLAPLFLCESGGELIVASHLADVVGEAGTGELDEEYVADHLTRGHIGPRTPYAHIGRLAPGESALWRNRRLERASTWTLLDPPAVELGGRDEYDAALRELVADGVRAALPPEGPVWSELSGGLDSTTVFCTAADLAAPELGAVSFVFPRTGSADERPWIEEVLAARPAPWQTIDVDAAPPFTELPAGFQAEPTHAFISHPQDQALGAACADAGVAALLTGEGGDAVFLVESQPVHLADLLRRGDVRTLARETRRWGRLAEPPRSEAFWLLEHGVRALWRSRRGMFVVPERMALAPRAAPWMAEPFVRRAAVAERERSSFVPRCGSVTVAWMLESVLRAAHSASTYYDAVPVPCPMRHPLLHRPLVAHVLGLPWRAKLDPRVDRFSQRYAFESVLPRRIVLRRGKSSPDEAIFRGLASKRSWRALLTDRPRIVERGYMDRAGWEQAVRSAALGHVSVRHFKQAAMLEAWLRQLDRAPRAQLPGAGDLTSSARRS